MSKHIASPVTLPRAVPGGSPPCAGIANLVEFLPFSVAKGLDDIIWVRPTPGISSSSNEPPTAKSCHMLLLS